MKDPRAEIINNLRRPENYNKACQRESEVWGAVFSDMGRDKRLALSQEAAKTLGVTRDRLDLLSSLKKHGIAPKVGLSLACGSGRAERALMKQGICERFDGIDIAEKAIEEARRLASVEALDISYNIGDLNKIVLQPEAYDLVVTQSCLHHVLELEHLAFEIWKSLRPGGVLWINDFIGESQFQWVDKRWDIAQYVFKLIPDELRWDSINQRRHKPHRPVPGKLVSPFEAIRSEEIIPVFLEHFDVLEKGLSNSILHLISHQGLYSTFASSERGREMFESLWQLDRILIESGTLPPVSGQFLMIKKTGIEYYLKKFLKNRGRR